MDAPSPVLALFCVLLRNSYLYHMLSIDGTKDGAKVGTKDGAKDGAFAVS